MNSKNQTSQLALAPGILADARGALWFPHERVLTVADLHFGYAWAHRHSGQLMPLAPHDDLASRIGALLDYYQDAKELVLLGDIVHKALPVEALRKELVRFFDSTTKRVAVRLILGNHDRKLPELLAQWSIPMECHNQYRLGDRILVHGDVPLAEPARCIIMGHEHPAIALGDGIATATRCPCFLVSNSVFVLPAFTRWSAPGGDVRRRRFLSPLASAADFQCAVAIVGERLLRIPL